MPSYKNRFQQVIKAPGTALGVLGNIVSDVFDWQHAETDESIDHYFSPLAVAKILEDNVAGIKTTELIAPISQASQAIQTQLDSLTQAKTGFEDIKEKLQQQITAGGPDVAANRVKLQTITQIETNLATTRGASFDLREFQKRIETLHELVKNDEVDDPRVIVAYIKTQYQKLVDQLEADKTARLKLIKDQLTLAKAAIPPLLSPAEFDKTESELSKNIRDAYDKAKNELKTDFVEGKPAAKKEDAATPSLFSTFDKAAERAEAELFNLVLFSEKTDSKEAVAPGLTATAGAAAHDPKKYRKISFEDYVKHQPERSTSWFSLDSWAQYCQYLMNNNAELYTPSGLRLKHNGKGEINISIPSRFSVYFHYEDRLLALDMMTVLKQLQAEGNTTVTLSLTSSDPKLRQKIMEEFYYAASMLGYPDDKIKFNITCPDDTRDNKQSIENKPASEIMGRLGSAPSKVGIKKQSWEAEKKEITQKTEKELRRNTDALDDKIETILRQPPLVATATP